MGRHARRADAPQRLVGRSTTGLATATGAAGFVGPLARRAALTLAIAAVCVSLLWSRLAALDLVALSDSFSRIGAAQWGMAALAAALSFWAVGQYDAVLHRHLRTGVADSMARTAGMSAIAVSQVLGLGVISGAIVRWRLLPGQSLATASRVTVMVALSFLAGWAVVTALVLLVLPDATFKLWAAAVLAVAGAATALCLAAPSVWPRSALQPRWPNLFTLHRVLILCAIDTLSAALAFYLLLPAGMDLAFAVILPAVLLALGAGLVSGTPGGIGAFEATLLALLPHPDTAALLATVLAWRVVCHAAPALVGAVVAARGVRGPAPPLRAPHPMSGARAEVALLRQGDHWMLGSGWLAGRTPHLLVGLFDPVGTDVTDRARFGRFAAEARSEARLPVLYKCTARTAVAARQAGQIVMRVAREAWLDPRHSPLTAASRAGLRRKLRQATVAGVSIISPAEGASSIPGPIQDLPWAAMDRIAAEWAAAHGGERGFSMGRYSQDYVAGQRVYLAYRAEHLLGFVTFHVGAREWTLDLMRHGPDLPCGTMHLLIAGALTDAARLGLPRLSLAAVPEAAFAKGRRTPVQSMLRLAGAQATGLAQFKSAFAPHWQPLYLTAPSRAALCVATIELARAIAAPPPMTALPLSTARSQSDGRHANRHASEIGFASARRPWHRRPD